MKKYSKPVRVGEYKFRYNYTDSLVEWLYTDKKTRKNEVLDSVGLKLENWKNKEVREEYLQEWAFELKCEVDDVVEMALHDYKVLKGA